MWCAAYEADRNRVKRVSHLQLFSTSRTLYIGYIKQANIHEILIFASSVPRKAQLEHRGIPLSPDQIVVLDLTLFSTTPLLRRQCIESRANGRK